MVADKITWKVNLDGNYIAKGGYSWLNRIALAGGNEDLVSWSWLWKLHVPEKLKFFS